MGVEILDARVLNHLSHDIRGVDVTPWLLSLLGAYPAHRLSRSDPLLASRLWRCQTYLSITSLPRNAWPKWPLISL